MVVFFVVFFVMVFFVMVFLWWCVCGGVFPESGREGFFQKKRCH